MSDDASGGVDAPPAFDPERHIDAMAPVLGLTIADARRPSVAQFLATAHAMARIVARTPGRGDHADLAPVFRPGPPEPTP